MKGIRVCVIGMGYVGLTLAIGLAQSGYRVIGVETDPGTLAALRKGIPHVHEPGLPGLYRQLVQQGSIAITDIIEDAIDAGVYIITVGTPLSTDGHSTTAYIEIAASDVLSVLKPDDLVILRSTARVGTTRNVVKPILDRGGVPYLLAMCPERTVEGRALEELRELPQLIGGIDAESARQAAVFFQPLARRTISLSSAESAELAKIVCNTQRDLQFAYANEVALMAENFGVDCSEVIEAANEGYPRSNLQKPGLVGGPCLEKDSYILAESVLPGQPSPVITLAARKLNESLIEHAVDAAAKALDPARPVRKVAILGLAFKGSPPTGDIRGSMAIPLNAQLRERFPQAEIRGFDPVASPEEASLWGLDNSSSLEEAAACADLIFIQTNHSLFCDAQFVEKLAKIAPAALVYDFWGCLKSKDACNIRIIGLGRASRRQPL